MIHRKETEILLKVHHANIFFFVFRRVKYYKFYRLRSGGGRKYRFFRKQGTDQSGENIAVLEALGLFKGNAGPDYSALAILEDWRELSQKDIWDHPL